MYVVRQTRRWRKIGGTKNRDVQVWRECKETHIRAKLHITSRTRSMSHVHALHIALQSEFAKYSRAFSLSWCRRILGNGFSPNYTITYDKRPLVLDARYNGTRYNYCFSVSKTDCELIALICWKVFNFLDKIDDHKSVTWSNCFSYIQWCYACYL